MERLILASGNAHKAQEMQALALAGGGPLVEIVTAASVGGMPRVVEDTGTFIGNAFKKGRALWNRLEGREWVLADDSGICVDALGGRPGVESAYFAGPGADGAANLAKLIERMRDVPDDRRGAHFVCVLALLSPRGEEWVFEGRCDGQLRREPSGGRGFGYDPLFVPAGESRTFAELDEAAKNRLSHRARAWGALARHLHRGGA